MKIDVPFLDRVTGHTRYGARKSRLAELINTTAVLMPRHATAQFLPQVLHESGRLKYVQEVWKPTQAQKRYEGRRDLGNTRKGDGKLFMGRDMMQITGRYNYRALTAWCRETGRDTPDFEAQPDLLTDPQYLGLGALWYWTTRVPAKYVEAGDIEMVTRSINGGLNGYSDRLALYDVVAQELAEIESLVRFQAGQGLVADGICGPKTRAALHRHLKTMPRLGIEVIDAFPAPSASPPAGNWLSALLQLIMERFSK